VNKLPQGEQLKAKALDLGVDIQGSPITQSVSGRQRVADDHELQRRIIEAERSRRESKLWLIALISAIASVVSAATAIIVVLNGR